MKVIYTLPVIGIFICFVSNPGTSALLPKTGTPTGSIHGKEKEDPTSEGTQAKKNHLIDLLFSKEADWVATTCENGFTPVTGWRQAGLIVYTDGDNYLKWTYEFNWRKDESQSFHVVAEIEGVTSHDQPEKSETGYSDSGCD